MLQPGGTRKIDGDTKVRKKTKNGQRRNKSGGIKVRVKLPPIESYEKDVEFRYYFHEIDKCESYNDKGLL